MLKKICLLVASTILLSACEDKRVVWSPDTTKAAVLGTDGLRITDPSGILTKPILSDSTRFVWWPDSKQCVILRATAAKDWTEVEPMLTKKEAEQISTKAEKLFQEIVEVKGDKDALNKKLENDELFDKTWKAESVVYLDYKHGEELAKLIPDWNTLPKVKAYIYTLEKYNALGNVLRDPVLLKKSLHELEGIEVSPSGKEVCYVEEDQTHKLYLVSPDGKKTRLISSDCNKAPSWSTDGKSLYFIEAEGVEVNDRRLASIKCIDIDNDGKEIARCTQVAVNWDRFDIVKVLPDKSIIFSSRKITFPTVYTNSDLELFRKQNGKDEVEQLTQGVAKDLSLESFAVNPSGTKILLCSKSGAVHILTIADKIIQTILPDSKTAGRKFSPSWRNDYEICLAAKSEKQGAGKEDAELCLINVKDRKIKVLSSDWPESCTNDFLTEKEKN